MKVGSILFVLACLSAAAQQFKLRPQTKQSIALYFQARLDLVAAIQARDTVLPGTSNGEIKKLTAAVIEAQEQRDATLNSLTSQDQLDQSLASLHVQKATAIARLSQESSKVRVLAISRDRKSRPFLTGRSVIYLQYLCLP